MPRGKAIATAKESSPRDRAIREQVFTVFKETGPTRTYRRLSVAIKSRFGEIAPRTLQRWAAEDQWKSQLAEYDEQLALAATINLDSSFDKPETLYRAAHLALTRALSSIPTVTTPQEFKALIDAARIAIALADKLEEKLGKQKAQDPAAVRENMWRVLDMLEERARKYPKLPPGMTIDLVAETS